MAPLYTYTMEEDTTDSFDMAEYEYNLDKGAASVMPDDWHGHARVAIWDSEEVPRSMAEKATNKAIKIADKKGVKPERAANSLISKISEKLSTES